MGRLTLLLVAALAAVALGGSASAETHRLAIVIGNNAGAGDRPVLRFAEADADKLARTLTELGGIAAPDLFLLQGRRLGEISRAFDAAAARIADWRRTPSSHVLFLFYFSGHSDGESLEIGPERLSFRDLRERAERLGSDVRLLIVDSCKSGSLLQAKGATRAQPFEIHFDDELPRSGEVVITSSAADESSLESADIRGSFFTHHLVSGLRGAADLSGDGRVVLGEAYDYAFAHTMMATASTLRGTQHPSYDYRLSGEGELVLTELYAHSAGITVPAGYQRVLVTDLRRDEVVAELTTGTRARLALRPGVFGLRVWKDRTLSTGRVELADGDDRVLGDRTLVDTRQTPGTVKGSEPDAATLSVAAHPARAPALAPLRLTWIAAFGLTSGVTGAAGETRAARLAARASPSGGFELSLDGALHLGGSYSEYRSLLYGGYRAAVVRGRWAASLGARLGGGLVGERTASGASAASPAAGVAPSGELTWWMSPKVGLELEAEALVAVYRRDFRTTASVWPAAFLGVVASP